MPNPLILASASSIRQDLLRNAGVDFDVEVARVDEAMIRESLQAEGARVRDIADQLAEAKARKIGNKHPDRLILGADQVLHFDGQLYSKPKTPEEARAQLDTLCGHRHELLTAAVFYEGAKPVWRHVGVVKMHMRRPSESYLDDYVARNWDSIRYSVGAYKLEEEGIRLFQKIDGDYFHVLGLPLLEVLAYLSLRGEIEG